ncbi:MAG: PIN domain-containing protein [Promethearchaeia archaeon]
MKHKLKIYLDTSVVSALFDKRNPERLSLTKSFFKGIKSYSVYVSDITIAEIRKTPDDELKKKMITKIGDFSILETSNDIEDLANQIVQKGAINKSYFEDAYHIALAIFNDMDFLLSWNFRHIVRKKTRDIVQMICTLNNLGHIEIITPAELL